MAPSCYNITNSAQINFHKDMDESVWCLRTARVLTSTQKNTFEKNYVEQRLRVRPSHATSVSDLTNVLLREWSKIPRNTLLNLWKCTNGKDWNKPAPQALPCNRQDPRDWLPMSRYQTEITCPRPNGSELVEREDLHNIRQVLLMLWPTGVTFFALFI